MANASSTQTSANHHSRYIVFAIASSVLSSVATLFQAEGLKYINPLAAASVGVLFAGVLTLTYLALTSNLPSWKSLVEARKPILQLTLFRSVLSNIIFTIGLSYSSAIEAVFLTKMEPYLIIFWVWLLDRVKPTGKHLGLLLLHIAGAIILSVGGHGFTFDLSLFGDLVMVIAVCSAALSYRYAPQVTRTLKPLQTAAVVETLGGLITLPVLFFVPTLTFSHQYLVGWMYLGVHAILFYIISISLLYASLQGIAGWMSSALRATGPLVATPIAMIFLGESLTPLQALGAFTVLVTSALISKRERPAKKVQQVGEGGARAAA